MITSVGTTLDLATERIVAPIEGMHRAIAGRWFRFLGPVGEPVRIAHDTTSSAVYGLIRLTGTAVGSGLDTWLASEHTDTGGLQSFVNGLWGDSLGRHHAKLGISMALCDLAGSEIHIGPSMEEALPAATGRIVVLVHGLVETEDSWEPKGDVPSLGDALADDGGLTPVALRYNTGLRISENGEGLAALLAELQAAWPVDVESIALVGHSMGGLVVRSACEAAVRTGLDWVGKVTDVVTVGTPHRGAPLEKLANVAAWALAVAPSTRPLSEFINGRSAGIKDLRFGAIAESDWAGVDPDALLKNTVGDHQLPAHIDHHFVAGVITADPSHPVGAVVGDLMVRAGSGTGHQRLKPTNVAVLGGVRHLDLRHDEAVIDHIMNWITPPDLPA